MKILNILLASIFTLSLLACSKSKDAAISEPEQPSPVLGYWPGTYTIFGLTDKFNCAIHVKPGGSFRFYEMGSASDTTELDPGLKQTGTWAMIDDTFVMTLFISGTSNGVQASLQMNDAKDKMSGLWKMDGETTGKFDFVR